MFMSNLGACHKLNGEVTGYVAGDEASIQHFFTFFCKLSNFLVSQKKNKLQVEHTWPVQINAECFSN